MTPTKDELVALYRKRARNYDWTANLYYLIGFREWAYRRRAVAALRLRPGDTVVEMACGTGLNLPLLRSAVGAQGLVVGVDINDAMLARADARRRREGWTNVELVQSDAIEFDFPSDADGVISTFAITLVPEFDEIIRRGVAALAPGGRFVVLDFKGPAWPPPWLVKAFVSITEPFGVTLEMAARHPWESLERYAAEFGMEEIYFGFSYVAVGTAATLGATTAKAEAPAARR